MSEAIRTFCRRPRASPLPVLVPPPRRKMALSQHFPWDSSVARWWLLPRRPPENTWCSVAGTGRAVFLPEEQKGRLLYLPLKYWKGSLGTASTPFAPHTSLRPRKTGWPRPTSSTLELVHMCCPPHPGGRWRGAHTRPPFSGKPRGTLAQELGKALCWTAGLHCRCRFSEGHRQHGEPAEGGSRMGRRCR